MKGPFSIHFRRFNFRYSDPHCRLTCFDFVIFSLFQNCSWDDLFSQCHFSSWAHDWCRDQTNVWKTCWRSVHILSSGFQNKVFFTKSLLLSFLLLIGLYKNGDDIKYVSKYLLTVPLQVQTITVCSRPFQLKSVFTSSLCWWARFYEHSYIYSRWVLLITIVTNLDLEDNMWLYSLRWQAELV